jgi:hypothetical protein
MKRFWPYGLLLMGIMIIFVGFVYDVLFAGIPFQDPTPAMLATYNFHATIAATIRWVGAGISLLALIVIVIRWGLGFLRQ